jgi:hypothetical protein
MNNKCGKTIYEEGSSQEGFILKLERHGCMGKKGQTNLNDMLMFPFSRPILLISITTRHVMHNTNEIKEGTQLMIFVIPIGLHGQQLAIKKMLTMCLKVSKKSKTSYLCLSK